MYQGKFQICMQCTVRTCKVIFFSQFVSLHSHLLTGLRHLKELYLDANLLKHIDANAFIKNRILEEIHLQHNSLSFDDEANNTSWFTGPSQFQHLNALRVLNLSHNKVSHFLRAWDLNNRKLEELDLSYNDFVSLNFSTNLFSRRNISVDLNHNKINNITGPNNIIVQDGDFKTIWILNENPLKCDCRILNFVQFLKTDSYTTKSTVKYEIDNLLCDESTKLSGQLVSSLSPEVLLCPLEHCSSDVGCSCQYRPHDYTAIVNCSNASLTQFPNIAQIKNTHAHVKHIELHLEFNQITELPSNSSEDYGYVTYLNLSYNSVSFFGVENLPVNLTMIDLSYNKLDKLSSLPIEYMNDRTALNVSLIGNPLECDCESYVFIDTKRIADNITCAPDGMKISDYGQFCSVFGKTFIAMCFLSILIAISAVAMSMTVYNRYKKEMKMYLYDHGICLWCWLPSLQFWRYDAFVSFSHLETNFVHGFLIPELERKPHRFTLCVHSRDWLPGVLIPTQVKH